MKDISNPYDLLDKVFDELSVGSLDNDSDDEEKNDKEAEAKSFNSNGLKRKFREGEETDKKF